MESEDSEDLLNPKNNINREPRPVGRTNKWRSERNLLAFMSQKRPALNRMGSTRKLATKKSSQALLTNLSKSADIVTRKGAPSVFQAEHSVDDSVSVSDFSDNFSAADGPNKRGFLIY